MKRLLFTTSTLLLFVVSMMAIPPQPTLGYRWVLLEDYSDEFNGTALDRAKWNNFHPWWNGRAPALFSPDAISLADGKLVIKNGILDSPQGNFKYYGGAVTSVNRDAHYGYYECKFIASMTKMSTTFWMSNGKEAYTPTACDDRYSQELDIQECIGNPGTSGAFMRDNMGSNTHYRYVACGESAEKFYTNTPSRIKLSSGVGIDYHTYGAWWHDANSATFYANGQKGSTTLFNTEISDNPFDRPMFLCLVTETYAWTSPVDESELLDENVNKSYYDWVRGYKLVPINEASDEFEYEDIYTEQVSAKNISINSLDSIAYEYEYKANTKRKLCFKLLDAEDNIVFTDTIIAHRGYGRSQTGKKMESPLTAEVNYKMEVELLSFQEPDGDPIGSNSFYVYKKPASANHQLKARRVGIYPNPAVNIVRFTGVEVGSHLDIYSQLGQLIRSECIGNDLSINISGWSSGMYILKLNNQTLRLVCR